MNKRESGSVALAFVGFAVLVLTFKGTWGRAYHALVGSKGAPSGGASAGGAASGALAYPVHAGTLAFAGVTSGRPGQAPTATTRTVAQKPDREPAYRGGFETPFVPSGYTAGQVAAAAARYARGRSYNGAPYVPHMVMQEGHIEERNGVKGIYIKYDTPGAGASTEWTPL